ncbi:Putative Casein kinase II subunit beta [Rhizopus microsporus]|nr:Putative Casein kinase II subunit beta [Rhizopus microsporus]
MNVYIDGDDSASMDLDQPQSWISWFCSAPNHKYYAEIDEKFIEDPFNLSGLSSQVPLYKETLEVILNMEPNDAMYSRIPDLSLLQPSAELLYGLIHQRYIITKDGMLQMLEKYKAGEFGKCPRVYCDGCHLLPCGQHDTPKQSNVRLYCPNCKDIYIPPNPKYAHIDGKNLI